MIDDNAVLQGTLATMQADIKDLKTSLDGPEGGWVRLAVLEKQVETLDGTVQNHVVASETRHGQTQATIAALSTKIDEATKGIVTKIDALVTAKSKPFNVLDYVDAKTIVVIIGAIASLFGIGGAAALHSSAPTDPPPAITTSGAP